MGDRLATIDVGRKVGWAAVPPSRRELGPHLTHCRLSRYLRTTWHLDPSSCLTAIDKGRKLGAMLLCMGELGPHLTQCGLGRTLPRHQVASWSIQPFGQHYRQDRAGNGPIAYRANRFTNGRPKIIVKNRDFSWNIKIIWNIYETSIISLIREFVTDLKKSIVVVLVVVVEVVVVVAAAAAAVIVFDET